MLQEIQKICDGIEYRRDVPDDAKILAADNGFIIIVGGSDDLMYCYGAPCYLTQHCEHSYGWDGCDLTKIKGEKKLKKEAKQLGLKIWWCGAIIEDGLEIEGYNTDESGAFSYTVNEGIEFADFKVMEDGDVYCTGKVIKLPDGFKSSLKQD